MRFSIPYHVRDRHLFIPGTTGQGKSTEFHGMAYQDIKNGAGVCVIDPKGDLVKSLLDWIPEERVDDCVYLSLDNPVPLDVMSYTTPDEKETLVGDLKYLLAKGESASQAPLMHAILEELIYTLFEANEDPKIPPHCKATFLDIYHFLNDDVRRKELLGYVHTPRFLKRWTDGFPNPKDRQSTLTRMSPFVNNRSLAKILGTPNATLNITDLMNAKPDGRRKILLVDLGGVAESKMIYGALLISRIQQGAFSRHSLPHSERVPFYLYVDEFENFQTGSFHKIISQARGYRLCLTVGCQWLDQLSRENLHALFTVGSYIIFAMSPDDARRFKDIVGYFTSDGSNIGFTPLDVVKLPPHHAIYVIDKGYPQRRRSLAPPPRPTTSYAEIIKKRTVDNHACQLSEEPLALEGEREKPDPDPTVPPDEGKARGAEPPG